MTKTAFIYFGKGKNGGYIATKILHKARKGSYEKDIIQFETENCKGHHFEMRVTPREAIIIANALLHAVMLDENVNRKKFPIVKSK